MAEGREFPKEEQELQQLLGWTTTSLKHLPFTCGQRGVHQENGNCFMSREAVLGQSG